MPEILHVEPQWIGEFIEYFGIATYHEYGGKGREKPWPKMKRKEALARL